MSLSSSAATGFIGTVLDEMGEEKGMAFLRQLQKQRIAGVDVSARQVLDQVVAGEYAIALQIFNHHAVISAKKGAPVKWIAMEPATGVLSVVSIPKGRAASQRRQAVRGFPGLERGPEALSGGGISAGRPGRAGARCDAEARRRKFRSRFFSPEETAEKMPRWKKIYDEIFR